MKNYGKPVAIIFGGDDPYLNTDVARKFDAIFPNSRLTIVEHAGHYVQLDQPEKVSSAILTAIPNE